MASTRRFNTGATRNDSTMRINPEGFISPKVMKRYYEYMHKNRFRPNGEIRLADNWQLGITQQAYGESLMRHIGEFHERHRDLGNNNEQASPYQDPEMTEILCALMFNSMGYLFEELKKPLKVDVKVETPTTAATPVALAGRDFTGVLNRAAHDRTQLLEDASFGEADENKEDFSWGV